MGKRLFPDTLLYMQPIGERPTGGGGGAFCYAGGGTEIGELVGNFVAFDAHMPWSPVDGGGERCGVSLPPKRSEERLVVLGLVPVL